MRTAVTARARVRTRTGNGIFRDYNGIIKELLDENKELSEKLE